MSIDVYDRPTRAELAAENCCPDCGEQLDWAREECVTIGCPSYLSVTSSLEAESVYSPLRDVREPIADSERFLPVKESA